MSEDNAKFILVLILIFMFTIYSIIYTATGVIADNVANVCIKLYFFNAIRIYNSTITERLSLETPSNISLTEGFTQRSLPLLSYMVVFNESGGYYEFLVRLGEEFHGFFVNTVEICAKPLGVMLGYINMALIDPSIDPFNSTNAIIPEEITRDFLTTPQKIIVEKVVPAFEEWFTNKYKMSISNASKLGIAVTAGYFVYTIYITYNASAIPYGIEDVIEKRQGDCDDMSRVLAELLNYYGIPSVIVYGYAYIRGMEFEFPVENVTYIYMNNGPHAFTMAYIPGFGWLSLDFLAGSFITQPFIVEGYSRSTHVDEEAVSLLIDLHRKINATQLIGIFRDIDRPVSDVNSVEEWQRVFDEKLTKYRETTPPVIIITETTIETNTITTITITDTQVIETPSDGETTFYNTMRSETDTYSVVETPHPDTPLQSITTNRKEKSSGVEIIHIVVALVVFIIGVIVILVYKGKS